MSADQSLVRTIFRPAPEPSDDLPIGVRSTGHYRVRPPYICHVVVKRFVQLFWCIKGQGIIEFDGKEKTLNPRQVAIYMPGMLHKWFPQRSYWDFYWFTLDGPFAVPILTTFGLNAGIHDVGPAPTELFCRLQSVVRNPSRQDELQAGIMAYHILALASMRRQARGDEHVAMAIKHIHQEWASKTINVKTLASRVDLHRSALSRRFQRVTGVSPSNYIARLRIQNAIAMLQHTSLPVAAVAAQCGFTDQSYLARTINRLTGVSPRRFREQWRKS